MNYEGADPNYIAYQKFLSSEEWYDGNRGRFVAFVDGEFVDNDLDKTNLLGRVREMYKDKARFVTQVKREQEIVHIFN